MASDNLVENYSGHILTQIRSNLFIPAINFKRQEFESWSRTSCASFPTSPAPAPAVTANSVPSMESSMSSKLEMCVPFIIAPDAPPLFGKKGAAAEEEFKAMFKAGIISCSASSRREALLHMVKWRPYGDFRILILNLPETSTLRQFITSRMMEKHLLRCKLPNLS